MNQDIDSERFKIFLNMLEIIDFPSALWMPKLTNNIEILACTSWKKIYVILDFHTILFGICPVKFQNREKGIEFCRSRKIIKLVFIQG